MPDVREKLVEQKIKGGADSICPKCFHSKVCRARDNQPCVECNQFTDTNGVTIQRWIPVEERLPDHFGVFVVAISEPGNMRVGKDCADFDPFAKTWLPSMCWDRGYKVTHWMPLPEPPKEE